MIIAELDQPQDIEEYAARLGFWHAAADMPLSNSLFVFGSETADTARAIYELAYELEKESGLFYYTATHTVIARVKNWNDLMGYGVLIFIDKFDVLREVFFSYTDLDDVEAKIIDGNELSIKFTYEHDGIKVKKVYN
jgi:hypothetical protein